jgi:hypothetical protein
MRNGRIGACLDARSQIHTRKNVASGFDRDTEMLSLKIAVCSVARDGDFAARSSRRSEKRQKATTPYHYGET